MKKSVDSYVRRFEGWIRLFPQSFQDEYGAEMLQTMRDQLTEAAEHKVPLQDIYYSSLSDLPGSLAQEHLRNRNALPGFIEKSSSGIWFLFGVVLSAYAIIAGTTSGNQTAILLGSTVMTIFFTWYGVQLTRSLALAIIAPFFMLGGLVFVISAESHLVIPAVFTPIGSGLLGLFIAKKLSRRHRPVAERNPMWARGFRMILRWSLILFIVANCLALYDPSYQTEQYEMTSNIPLTRAQDNGWYSLIQAGEPEKIAVDITTTDGMYVTEVPYKSEALIPELQKQAEVGALALKLQKNEKVLIAAREASTFPSLLDPTTIYYGTGSSIILEQPLYISLTDINRLLLAEAVQALHDNNQAEATEAVRTGLILAKKSLASGRGWLSSFGIYRDDFAFIKAYPQFEPLLSELPTETEVTQSALLELRIMSASMYTDLADSRWEGYIYTAPKFTHWLPYSYQKNRTLHAFYEKYLETKGALTSSTCTAQEDLLFPSYEMPRFSESLSTFISPNGAGKAVLTMVNGNTSASSYYMCTMVKEIRKLRDLQTS